MRVRTVLAFTLTVNGEGFISSSTVNWNGSNRMTTEMDTTTLTAAITAADIAAFGIAQITVVNPTPGGGTSNPVGFIIAGTPGFVYVANSTGGSPTPGNISAFSVDPNTGILSPVPGSPFQVGSVAAALTADPSSRFLYVANGNFLSAFTINPIAGILTPVPGSPSISSGLSPASVSVDFTGKFLYSADSGPGNGPNEFNSISEYSIDATTGALTPISQVPCPYSDSPTAVEGRCNAVIADPVGSFLFGSNSLGAVDVFSITTQGMLQPVAGSPFSITMNDSAQAVAVGPTGNFVYTANYYTLNISAFRITPASGALTPVPGTPFAIGGDYPPSALVADPLGRFLYVLDFGAGVSGFSINPSTGALTLLAGFPFNVPNIPSRTPLAVDPSGKFLYVGSGLSYQASSVYAFAIDATTGALTAVPGSPFTVDGTPQAITVTQKIQ